MRVFPQIARRRGCQVIGGIEKSDEETRVDENGRHRRLPRKCSVSRRFECLATSVFGFVLKLRSKNSLPRAEGDCLPACASSIRSRARLTASLGVTRCETQYSASFC